MKRHIELLVAAVVVTSTIGLAAPVVDAETRARMVLDIVPGLANSSPAWLTEVNGTLFFTVSDPTTGAELWKSDGTAAGTTLVADINPGAAESRLGSFTELNGTLFFQAFDGLHGPELWKSDGTAVGTTLVADINPGIAGSSPSHLTEVNGTLFFTPSDGTHGYELWKSDGTAAGTTLVADINPGAAGSGPERLTGLNGILFFHASDGAHGVELWKSDGTAAGTTQVADIDPGIAGSVPDYLRALNGELLFTASDGSHGRELWKSDGTAAGTTMLADISPAPGMPSWPEHVTTVNGTLWFTAHEPTTGYELWKSDGTAAGTTMVADVYPGALPPTATRGPNRFTEVSGTLFFTAADETHGAEMWTSDGTAAGTLRLPDINQGWADSSPSQLTEVNGTLFFSANDGTHGFELWKISPDANAAPVVTITTPPDSPRGVGRTISLTASFTDADVDDTHTCSIDWGDGAPEAGTVSESDGAGTCDGSHVYGDPGGYRIVVTVTDDSGGSGTAETESLAFTRSLSVAGWGWFTSQEGSYTADPDLVSRTAFRLSAKYRRRGTVPVGVTKLALKNAPFLFVSTAYDWLAMTETGAEYEGSGTVNGEPGYDFRAVATDGSSTDGVDRFGITIWRAATGEVVYDNISDGVGSAATNSSPSGDVIRIGHTGL